MVKEDTFHFQDDRIRIPFRDMTTSEAEYHAETMWPYYDEKISALLEQKTKMLCLEFREEIIINQMNQMFGINLNNEQEKEKLKRIFQLFKVLVEIQQRFYSLLNRVFVPWDLAASTGLLGILIKQYFPYIRYYL
ncbi:MAG: hypothetical protein H6905_06800 [Hyphomicrobiales bacterium]|nr:hypothetical protein [Hyphomicrobiales bacterium]